MVTLVRTVPVDAALRSGLAEARGLRINDLVLAAAASALKRHPALNAWLVDNALHHKNDVDLAFAVALDQGLVTPVIRRADSLSAEAVARCGRELTAKARAGRLSLAELADATFTVSNLGGLGVDLFTPIINPPQVAILGVGTMRQEPELTGSGIAFRRVVSLCLVFDHRALDGADGARFLATLAELLAHPADLLRSSGGSA
jgi:pyruvate dehydrogenase E2 component (dihydrolipoamide acetyltransferase)